MYKGGEYLPTAKDGNYDGFDVESVGESSFSSRFTMTRQKRNHELPSNSSVYSSATNTTNTSGSTATTGISSSLRYNEHAMDLEHLAEAFETDINFRDPIRSFGLTAGAANERQQSLGKNLMTQHKSTHPLKLFVLQFTDTFMLLLQFAAFLSLLSWTFDEDPVDLYIGIFLLGAILLQCIATFRQEARSDKLMEKFRMLTAQFCICIREGVQLQIDSQHLVVGDLIKLYAGCKVPSDCRLLYLSPGYVFRVDQSSITGENEPVECNCAPSTEENVLDAYNIVFSGSLVVEGEALALVIRSGDDTLLGDMVKITGTVDKDTSTLKKDLQDFVWVVARLSIGIGVIVFLLGIYRGLPIMETLMDGLVGMLI